MDAMIVCSCVIKGVNAYTETKDPVHSKCSVSIAVVILPPCVCVMAHRQPSGRSSSNEKSVHVSIFLVAERPSNCQGSDFFFVKLTSSDMENDWLKP